MRKKQKHARVRLTYTCCDFFFFFPLDSRCFRCCGRRCLFLFIVPRVIRANLMVTGSFILGKLRIIVADKERGKSPTTRSIKHRFANLFTCNSIFWLTWPLLRYGWGIRLMSRVTDARSILVIMAPVLQKLLPYFFLFPLIICSWSHNIHVGRTVLWQLIIYIYFFLLFDGPGLEEW